MEGQAGDQKILETIIDVGQGVESATPQSWSRVLDMDKRGKSSQHLGILQKEGKKGASEKSVKVGRKKDLEKIKMIGETLVESGSIKTLDSHFSTPPK
jgi:hypothetical protein